MFEKFYENQIKIALFSFALLAAVLFVEVIFTASKDVSAVYIGNSDMEIAKISEFVMKIAKSSDQEENRFHIEAHAGSQLSLSEQMGRTEPKNILPKGKWDYILLQEHGIEMLNSEGITRFFSTVDNYSKVTRQTKSKLVLVSTWPEQLDHPVYGWQQGTHYAPPESPEFMNQQIEDANRYVAGAKSLDFIPVGSAWVKARENVPDYPLYNTIPNPEKGISSRPSLHGIYLTALMIYDYLSEAPLASVTFVPEGLSREDVENLKRIAGLVSTGQKKLANFKSTESR